MLDLERRGPRSLSYVRVRADENCRDEDYDVISKTQRYCRSSKDEKTTFAQFSKTIHPKTTRSLSCCFWMDCFGHNRSDFAL